MNKYEGLAYGIQAPEDAEGNEKQYRLQVNVDGEDRYVVLSNDQLRELFRDWQLNVPEATVTEPFGWLTFTDGLSPRETAIVQNALRAYHRAGRLNLDEKEDAPLHGLEYQSWDDMDDN